MNSSASKALELIIKLHNLNEKHKTQTNEIGGYLSLCIGEVIDVETGLVSSRYRDEPCLTEWLTPEVVDCDSGYGKCVYFYTQDASSDDCPHCYNALLKIQERKELRLIRGRIKAQITNLAKREIQKD